MSLREAALAAEGGTDAGAAPFFQLALALAKRGLGQTWPNPSVGAVIAEPGGDGRILGCGWTARGGRPHAEAIALMQAGAKAQGAVLYVTLEPCAHHGFTPPCADAIIKAGIRRVVYGIEDPDPRVSGRGLERLKAGGVEVMRAACSRAAYWLSLGHILRTTRQRPFVQLKAAVSANGLMAAGKGEPVWVTGPEARACGHLMRAETDAIIIGRGALAADDPELTCRLPGLFPRSPVRVIFSSKADVSGEAKLFRDIGQVPLWILCLADAPQVNTARLARAGALCLAITADEQDRLDTGQALQALAGRGITRVLVEGGPTLAESFLDAGAVDEIVIFQGARTLDVGLKPFASAGLEFLSRSSEFKLISQSMIGEDKVIKYRNIAHFQ